MRVLETTGAPRDAVVPRVTRGPVVVQSTGSPVGADFDVIVVGAGAAGLSLGRRVALADARCRMLVLDARRDYEDDRTWSFWSDPTHDLRHLVRHEWHQWRFDDGGSPCDHAVAGSTYQAIRSIDFYREACRVIELSRSVRLQMGVEVTDLGTTLPRASGARVAVETSAGTFFARYVIDTRPRVGPSRLFQCFAGAEVNHGGHLPFPDDVAGLMTRMRVDEHGFAFTYVLPYTDSTALVEFTRFSRHRLSLEQLAKERDTELSTLGLNACHVEREERGVLPMGSCDASVAVPDGVLLAGNGGGAIRQATGYAFMRIQRWATACASRLASGAAPIGHPRDGVVHRQLDRIFLQVLRETPQRTPEYFMALASRVAPDRLLRFLTDRATLLDMAAIVASLPLMPFLGQVPYANVDAADDSGQRGITPPSSSPATQMSRPSSAHAP